MNFTNRVRVLRFVFMGALLGLLVASLALAYGPGYDMYSHYLAPDHMNSPVGFGTSAYGTLRDDAAGHPDQRLCVAKTGHADYTAVSRGHNAETNHTYTVTDRDFGDGHASCMDTDHNLEKHQAGKNDWDGVSDTQWGDVSWHISGGGGGGGGAW